MLTNRIQIMLLNISGCYTGNRFVLSIEDNLLLRLGIIAVQ